MAGQDPADCLICSDEDDVRLPHWLWTREQWAERLGPPPTALRILIVRSGRVLTYSAQPARR
jgi:hypothetical protein